jgi:nitrite reductase/ring-hydroxylating ferredoxin subunit
MQQRISEVLIRELHAVNPDLETRGLKAWSALLTVLTEQLARVYGEGKEPETYLPREEVNEDPLHELAEDSYERASGLLKPAGYRRAIVGPAASIADGQRKIIEAEGQSIGVFHVGERWYALNNSCLHRGGPVCTGKLEGMTLTCPWHGYQYDITTGQLLLDHSSRLPTYRVAVEDGQVYVDVPVYEEEEEVSLANLFGTAARATRATLAPDSFRVQDVKPGHAALVVVDGQDVAVFNVDGTFFATQNACTHADGPLNEGPVEGCQVMCPWHASVFDVRDGSVIMGPAEDPLKTFKVVIEGEIGRVTT